MKNRFLRIADSFKEYLAARSLRMRIFVLLLLAGILPGILMRHAIIVNYEDRAVSQRIATVTNQLRILSNHLVSNKYFTYYRSNEQQHVSSREVINAELEMLSNLYEGRVMIIDGNFKVIKDTYGLSEGKTMISEEVIKCFQGSNTSHYDPEHGYIEMTVPISDTTLNAVDDSVIYGVMLTSISNDSILATMEVLNRQSMTIEILMIMVIFGVALVFSGLLIRPFDKVTKAVNEVKAGYSNEIISVPDYAETVHIVDAFNELLRRMKVLDDSRTDFVANVSHELKTPMTSIKVLADSLIAQGDAPAELYKEFMEDIVSEIDRENKIITDLLALVKMDKKVQDMNIVSISINDLTELILKRLRPIARKKDVEIVFESLRQITAEVDEVKMTLIITNLVENAIKYNREHGLVKVQLDADHQNFILKVNDSGIGIPEEELPNIYERFYRVDKSHSREIGGTGLGLSIAKNAVIMHRGTIDVKSVIDEGTEFTVTIPLNFRAAE
ncbi:MAG: ATP-binding protein [Lachnospiraceae bacterium]|nr:ATP-binding protein [Lachnospiraceae bacterium]